MVHNRATLAEWVQHEGLSVTLARQVPFEEAEFLRIVAQFPELSVERTAQGDIVVVSPVFPRNSQREGLVYAALLQWSLTGGGGEVFPASVLIRLPSGAIRSPDATWVSAARMAAVRFDPENEPLLAVPEFLVEIRSRSNRLPELQAKMAEYTAAGVVVGWLLDPTRGVWQRYTADGPGPEVTLVAGTSLTEPDLLPGFTLSVEYFLS